MSKCRCHFRMDNEKSACLADVRGALWFNAHAENLTTIEVVCSGSLHKNSI